MRRDSSNFAKDKYFNGHSGSRSVQANFNLITSFIQEAVDKYIPSKTSRSVASVPWITSEVRRNIRKRNKTHARHKRLAVVYSDLSFRNWNSKSKLISRSNMILFVNKLAGDIKVNPKDFYRYTNSQRKEISVSLLSKGETVVVWLSLKLSRLRSLMVSLQMYSPKLRKMRSLYWRSQFHLWATFAFQMKVL